jgi:hypothetical protein
MDYRNDRDALRGRIEELEVALEEARRGERITRLEVSLMEADVLTRRLRGELSALQQAQARGVRVSGLAVIEAEVGHADRSIERLRALVHKAERAPEEAEALVRRLRRGLSAIEDVHPLGPHRLDRASGANAKVGLALAGMALVVLGLAAVVRHARVHEEACSKAAVCCLHGHGPAGAWCHAARHDCEAYLERWGCDDAPANAR